MNGLGVDEIFQKTLKLLKLSMAIVMGRVVDMYGG